MTGRMTIAILRRGSRSRSLPHLPEEIPLIVGGDVDGSSVGLPAVHRADSNGAQGIRSALDARHCAATTWNL